MNTGYYLSELFKDYWIKAEIQLGIAIAILCLLMCVVYGLKVGIRLMTPVIIALLAAYSTLSVLNYSINLFSIMPAFLILGIGVDYTIYFYSNNLKNSLTSIALLFCMLTSIIGFGLLALSSTYAVKSFGMLILFGVLYSYIFAFISIPPKCLND
ncbi:hypothetical protein GKC56_03920 [Neisseriaceae bacterium PsAf]|nr:hypothetical protein [Neisseriaceae bacterium PsAf]